jgi:hypothetical protein
MHFVVRLRLLRLRLAGTLGLFLFGRRCSSRLLGLAVPGTRRLRGGLVLVVFAIRLFGLFLDRHGACSSGIFSARRRIRIVAVHAEPPLYRERNILVDGAGVRLLFLDAKLRQQLQYSVGLDFQFASELIDSDFQLHR